MTALMEKAVERLRDLPADRQDGLARLVLMLADAEAQADELTEDDIAAIERSRAQAARGDFATDEQMRAIRAQHGR